MSEPTLEVMVEQLKQLYIKHDKLITEIKQTKEDIEMLQTLIMYKSNKDARIIK